ncbi:2,3-dehydroadipyl-CoA hydratase [bacterium BMS3Abin03]|nr:2,3-dehydroadipyl-CoA hydratase [bacterium BMS3Abin03]
MIKYVLKGNTAIIILNRPEKRNALHPELIKQFKEKLKEAEKDENVKAVIITGEGKAFCAGADLEYLKELSRFSSVENEKDSGELAELFLMIYKFPKPTIAAVNGAAIAGGCGLATVCDLIVAHPDHSKFGYSEVKIGFIPAIVSIFIIKRIGEGIAKQLLLTGEIINGKRAYELGLANFLYNNVLDGALEVASNILKNSAFSMQLTKSMINTVSNLSVEDAVNYCIRLNAVSRGSADFKKGLESFIKK